MIISLTQYKMIILLSCQGIGFFYFVFLKGGKEKLKNGGKITSSYCLLNCALIEA
jgi:hypothetical protein